MKAWWQTLNAREQKLVLGLGAFFLVVLMWRFMWIPWRESIEQAKEDRASQKELVLWMRRVVPVIEQTKSNAVQGSNQDALSSRIEKLLADAPLERAKIELGVNEDGSVSMRLDSVVFDDLTAFMRTMAIRAGVTVESVDLRRSDEGMVSGDLGLR
jgi:general secretion pathway protein M